MNLSHHCIELMVMVDGMILPYETSQWGTLLVSSWPWLHLFPAQEWKEKKKDGRTPPYIIIAFSQAKAVKGNGV